ncbi:MAG: histidine kinase [Blastocatellia bacterium]
MNRRSSSIGKIGAGLIDGRLIAATRLILAISAFLIVDYSPGTYLNSAATRLVLVLYLAYGSVLYILAARKSRVRKPIPAWSYWADIIWYTSILALSGGANSIFFFGYFFAILVASFEWGFRAGLAATIVSGLLFIKVSLATGLGEASVEWHRPIVRLVYLLVLGYLMAHWGGLKIKLFRQFSLLKEIATVSPPRQGVDHLIDSTLERLRAFYDADAGLLVVAGPDTSEYRLHRVKRSRSTTPHAEPIPSEMLQVLLTLPPEYAVVSSEGFRGLHRLDYAYDLTKLEPVAGVGHTSKTLTALLDAKSFITVPLRYQNQTLGRLYLTAQRRRAFEISDVDFFNQITDHLVPVINSIRLVDRLAAEAAEEERQRIARDIHDTIIQPYIGLQMGLSGIRRKLAGVRLDTSDGIEQVQDVISDATADTDRLIEMTSDGISDLRGYVHGLREAGGTEDSLMPAVRRFASKFSQATNIIVQVRADTDIHLDDRLATETFQMIVEGLSNIRRHTQSARAFIGLERSDSRLILRIENDGTRGSVPPPFTPRSIAERAQLLGGRAYVETFGDMGTSVIVEVPV